MRGCVTCISQRAITGDLSCGRILIASRLIVVNFGFAFEEGEGMSVDLQVCSQCGKEQYVGLGVSNYKCCVCGFENSCEEIRLQAERARQEAEEKARLQAELAKREALEKARLQAEREAEEKTRRRREEIARFEAAEKAKRDKKRAEDASEINAHRRTVILLNKRKQEWVENRNNRIDDFWKDADTPWKEGSSFEGSVSSIRFDFAAIRAVVLGTKDLKWSDVFHERHRYGSFGRVGELVGCSAEGKADSVRHWVASPGLQDAYYTSLDGLFEMSDFSVQCIGDKIKGRKYIEIPYQMSGTIRFVDDFSERFNEKSNGFIFSFPNLLNSQARFEPQIEKVMNSKFFKDLLYDRCEDILSKRVGTKIDNLNAKLWLGPSGGAYQHEWYYNSSEYGDNRFGFEYAKLTAIELYVVALALERRTHWMIDNIQTKDHDIAEIELVNAGKYPVDDGYAHILE